MKNLIILILIFTHIFAEDIELNNIKEEVLKALFTDNKDLLKTVKVKLEKIVKKKYTPVRGSYLGSVTAKTAIYSFFPWTKMSYAKSGSRMLDKAIKEKPNNLTIRLNRTFAYLRFPKLLKKSTYLNKDARWFVKGLKEGKIKNKNFEVVYKALSMFFIKRGDDKRYMKFFLKLKNKENIQQVKNFKISED